MTQLMKGFRRSRSIVVALLAATIAGCPSPMQSTDSGTPDTGVVDVTAADATGTDVVAVVDVPSVIDNAVDDTGDVPQAPPDVQRDSGADIVDVARDVSNDMGLEAAADVPGDIARDTPADMRVDTGPPIPCSDCRTMRCMTSSAACDATTFCAERLRCLDRCPTDFDPPACRSGCMRAWPATTQSTAFDNCLRMMCPGSCPQYL